MTTELRGRKIVLIGGAGFIGHNLALELKQRGAEVSIVDGLQVNSLLSLHDDSHAAMPERSWYLSMINERLEASAKAVEANAPIMAEIRAVTRRLEGASGALTETLAPKPGTKTVRWLERQGREKSVAATAVPLGEPFRIPHCDDTPSMGTSPCAS